MESRRLISCHCLSRQKCQHLPQKVIILSIKILFQSILASKFWKRKWREEDSNWEVEDYSLHSDAGMPHLQQRFNNNFNINSGGFRCGVDCGTEGQPASAVHRLPFLLGAEDPSEWERVGHACVNHAALLVPLSDPERRTFARCHRQVITTMKIILV